MTLLIAHRGLLDGPDSAKENQLSTIMSARSQGYDVEIDVWRQDNRWYLGHDNPQTEIDYEWLCVINNGEQPSSNHAWVHAKNIEALYWLSLLKFPGHVFFHDRDAAVLTSTGYLWTYAGKELTELSVCVMPEWTDAIDNCQNLNIYGFCTDYVHMLQDKLTRNR
jgi:hypothetical protein